MDKTPVANKTEMLFVRVTPAIAARLDQVAAANGRRPSEELRAALLAHLDKHSQPAQVAPNAPGQGAGVREAMHCASLD